MLGGTRFVGRAICSELTSRGHELLVVHRGRAEPDDLAPVQHLHADRASWASQGPRLASFGAEAAVDVSALNGVGAESALRALPPGLRLVVISSGDVYRAYESLHAGTHRPTHYRSTNCPRFGKFVTLTRLTGRTSRSRSAISLPEPPC